MACSLALDSAMTFQYTFPLVMETGRGRDCLLAVKGIV